jgi:hypothetical protein
MDTIFDELMIKFINPIEDTISRVFEKYKYEAHIEPEPTPKTDERKKNPREEKD